MDSMQTRNESRKMISRILGAIRLNTYLTIPSTKPVNYLSRELASIEEDIDYAVKIASNYAQTLSDSGIELAGKTLLELGPGPNLGSALYLSSLGARVMVADRFLAPWEEPYHYEFYRKLRWWIKEHVLHANTASLDKIIASHNYQDDAILRFEAPVEDLSAIANSSVDIVLSNAVLEHVMNPKMCFKELFRITASHGIQFHQVDFRDHKDFSRPLDFLLLDDSEYEKIFTQVNGERGNRWRPHEYETLMRQVGFSNIAFHPNIYADEAYLKTLMSQLPNALGSKYHSSLIEDLRVTSGCYLLECGGGMGKPQGIGGA